MRGLWCVGAALLGCAEIAGLDGFEDPAAGVAGGPGAEGGSGAVASGGGGTGADGGGDGKGGSAGAPPACDAYCEAVLADRPLAYWRLGQRRAGEPALDEVRAYPGQYVEAGRGNVDVGQPALIESADTALRLQNGAEPAGATMVVDPAPNFPGQSPFTIEMWVRPTAIEYGLLVARVAAAMPRGFYLQIQASPNLFQFRREAEGQVDTVNAPVPGVATTVHLVATYDGATMALYVDGVLGGTMVSVKQLDNFEEPMVFGHSVEDAVLDEIAIYPFALSPARIAVHYAVGGSG